MLSIISNLCVSVMSIMYISKEYTKFYEITTRTYIYFERMFKDPVSICEFESKGTQTYDEFEFEEEI
jgi:hypothetical protein